MVVEFNGNAVCESNSCSREETTFSEEGGSTRKREKRRIEELGEELEEVGEANVIIDQRGKGLGLAARSPFAAGDLVLKELPLLGFTNDGFCPFCSARHLELTVSDEILKRNAKALGANNFSPEYLKQLGFQSDSLNLLLKKEKPSFSPICNKALRMNEELSEALSEIENDQVGNFSAADYRELRLALLFAFRLADASESQAESEHSLLLGKLEKAMYLHSECSCESLKTEEKRYTVAESLRKALLGGRKALAEAMDVEEITELLSILGTNCFEVNLSSEAAGCALYLVSSLINHSCDPNCFFTFDNQSLEIRVVASREISLGEEITISYDSLAQSIEDTFERVLYISQNLGFVCGCSKCVLN